MYFELLLPLKKDTDVDVLKRLRSYLEDTPKEQVLSDWKATADKSSNNDERFSLTKFIDNLKNK